jgi:hypothetical protein
MIDLKTVDQLKQAPIEERLQIIELILQSLKKDIRPKPKIEETRVKPFKVRKFSLGQEVHVDREELYSERGL